ncbi:hypothetical protein CEXT_250831 [Caerostris extrusa]|uniref:Uncharacterized protein n=1 Tax=Caerostris extrusa TaxID=172846 RepID=A0AAV4TH79_CAEEX|nr:hypothetical protein CEXT_250831 [Caerostris extrusa]
MVACHFRSFQPPKCSLERSKRKGGDCVWDLFAFISPFWHISRLRMATIRVFLICRNASRTQTISKPIPNLGVHHKDNLPHRQQKGKEEEERAITRNSKPKAEIKNSIHAAYP